MSKDSQNLVWLDLEMTGLDPNADHILEIAVAVTDNDLNVIDASDSLAIYQPSHILGRMDEWNQLQHRKSGLLDRVMLSNLSVEQAEQKILDLIKQYVFERKSPMCGNTICQDRRFLANYMPELEAYFHYRNLDVSSINEMIKRWRPSVIVHPFRKKMRHLALEDVKESIEELRFYLTRL